jgi:hypothetical protein
MPVLICWVLACSCMLCLLRSSSYIQYIVLYRKYISLSGMALCTDSVLGCEDPAVMLHVIT